MKPNKEKLLTNLSVRKYLTVILPELQQERTQKFTNLVLTLLGLCILGFFAIEPTLATITNLQKELSDDTFVNHQLQEKIADLSSLQQSYRQLQPDIPAALKAIPQTAQAPILVGQIQAIAHAHNVNILTIEVFQVELTHPVSTVKSNLFSFSFSAQGTQNDLITFVNALATMERIITFDTISLNTNKGGNSITLNTQGSAYFKQ